MQFSLADRDAIWASKLSWVPLCAHVHNASLLQANSRDVSRETSVRFPFLSAAWSARARGSRSAGACTGTARDRRGRRGVRQALRVGSRSHSKRGVRQMLRVGTRSARHALRTARDRRGALKTRSEVPPRLRATGKRARVAHSASPVWQSRMFHVKHLCGFTCSLRLTQFLPRAHDYSL